ncbi:MAG TPA: RDD family protein [Terriglobia bacterium]|nr:RDD family protein [Terriglobia bacterium]
MKCPKCGFVSFPGLAACKKCGRPFDPFPEAVSSGSTRFSHLVSLGQASGSEPRFARQSLAERVAHFRHRQVGLRGGEGSDRTLEFDFENRSSDGSFETARDEPDLETDFVNGPKESDLVAGRWRRSEVSLDAISLDDAPKGSTPDLSGLDGAGDWTGEWTAEWTIDARSGLADSSPVEIVLGNAPGAEADPRFDSVLPDSAPLGRRFSAGLLDALMLTAAASLFVLVFWVTGGRFHAQPAELAVAAFVGAFFVLFYFGLFGALALATPGERWCGLMVRNLDGGFPAPQESLWRALGYLVSISALMVGFIWALVDSDGLTWHDRMSGTYLGIRGQGNRRMVMEDVQDSHLRLTSEP